MDDEAVADGDMPCGVEHDARVDGGQLTVTQKRAYNAGEHEQQQGNQAIVTSDGKIAKIAKIAKI